MGATGIVLHILSMLYGFNVVLNSMQVPLQSCSMVHKRTVYKWLHKDTVPNKDQASPSTGNVTYAVFSDTSGLSKSVGNKLLEKSCFS